VSTKVVVAEIIELDTPLERAWEFVSNFERFPDWFSLHEGFPKGPPPSMDEVGEGTVVTEKIKVMGIPADVEWTVVEWSPPHVVGIDGAGPMGTQMGIRALVERSEDGGTRVTHESSFSGAAITPMLSALEKEARKAAAESLARVRELLGEAGPAPVT
jgi:carbon monoxide dehydrogenase subunit G